MTMPMGTMVLGNAGRAKLPDRQEASGLQKTEGTSQTPCLVRSLAVGLLRETRVSGLAPAKQVRACARPQERGREEEEGRS